MLDAAKADGVVSLVYSELKRTCLENAPEDVRLSWVRAAALASAGVVTQDLRLTETLKLLASAGIAPILLKGAGLSHTLYPANTLRPRGDSDLLIRAEERMAADRVLREAGYEASAGIAGELISFQRIYHKRWPGDAAYGYDIHWRVSNCQLIAHSSIFSFDACLAGAVPVPALGPHARTLGKAQALLLACVHRLGHTREELRLIWAYDIWLLANSFDETGFERFVRLAEENSLAGACKEEIANAVGWFGTDKPWTKRWLETPGPRDASSALLLRQKSRAHALWSDLRSLPRWGQRARLLLENTLPSRAYIRQRYGVDQGWKLPYYYVMRALKGAAKLRR